jgi:hypothetical protein
VLTGPVYAPMCVNGDWVSINRTIGSFPKLVHVPTHFYKVVFGFKYKNKNGASGTANQAASHTMAAFTSAGEIPNTAIITDNSPVFVGAFLVENSDSVSPLVSAATISLYDKG